MNDPTRWVFVCEGVREEEDVLSISMFTRVSSPCPRRQRGGTIAARRPRRVAREFGLTRGRRVEAGHECLRTRRHSTIDDAAGTFAVYVCFCGASLDGAAGKGDIFPGARSGFLPPLYCRRPVRVGSANSWTVGHLAGQEAKRL
ncbi:hypothetical protein HPB50_019648 [Hyalomma asiaticum]|uniref:Uncharacterized protein n=1 Tax=Hyalomma asiaticum TaxID=266040 RepID=A0ACB7SJ15_HYAAI|nr:hypothetical protein HPB50_019648 [Hyalomma asiaticum]